MEDKEHDEQLHIRKELARAFGWFEKRNPYDGYDTQSKPLNPTWEQIFVEIGRLKAYQKTLDVLEHFSQHLKEQDANPLTPPIN